jgi:phosphate transport system permease protein
MTDSPPTDTSTRTSSPSLGRLLGTVADRIEPAVEWLIRLCGWSSILFVAAILFFVFWVAFPALFGKLNLIEFFTSPNWRPTSPIQPHYGTLAMLVGTLAVTGLAMLMAVPLGLGAAVYVSEFAGAKAREVLKVVIEILAAIPSIVWGFVGYMVLGPLILRTTGAAVGINLLNAGILLALMSVPIIVSVGEDALKAVPDSYREAALALGASRWEIVYRVLFPAAKNGLLAAVLLGIGRAVGETMLVLMATGNAVLIPHSVLDPVRTLTATIAAELGETVQGDLHCCTLFAIGLMLFAISFAVNLAADLIVKGIRMEKRG